MLIDENGNKGVNDEYEVIGGAKLLGLEKGDNSNTESYKKNYRKTFEAVNILYSNHKTKK